MSQKGNQSHQSAVKDKKKGYRVTWAQAVRDIVIASMNRGQLPVLGLIGLMLFMIWKMPAEDVTSLAMAILQRLVDWTLAGWALAAAITLAWYVHARKMRQEYSQEFERIGTEKSKLQSSAAGRTFPGSNGRR